MHLNPTTESKRAVKQLIRYPRGTHNTLFLSDSDWTGDSATRQSVSGHHCNLHGLAMCNRCLKQTAISLSSCEAELLPAHAQDNFWVSQNSTRTSTTTFQFVTRWIQIRHVTFCSEEDLEDSSTLQFDAKLYNNRTEKNVYRSDART